MLGIVDLAGFALLSPTQARVRSRVGILLLASVQPEDLPKACRVVRTLLLGLGTIFLFGVFPKKELENLGSDGEAVPLELSFGIIFLFGIFPKKTDGKAAPLVFWFKRWKSWSLIRDAQL